jgi:hypothetical protein
MLKILIRVTGAIFGTTHSTIILDPLEVLISILVIVRQFLLPGLADRPAAPCAGGPLSTEVADEEVGRGWCGVISRLSLGPLLTQRNAANNQAPCTASDQTNVRPPSKQPVVCSIYTGGVVKMASDIQAFRSMGAGLRSTFILPGVNRPGPTQASTFPDQGCHSPPAPDALTPRQLSRLLFVVPAAAVPTRSAPPPW